MKEHSSEEARYPTPRTAAGGHSGNKRRVESIVLFQGEREIVIVHHGEEYSLRVTRNGKLILTK